MTKASAKLTVELINITREIIGPIAAFRLVAAVEALPRTRSGNIYYCVQFAVLTCNLLRKNYEKSDGRFSS